MATSSFFSNGPAPSEEQQPQSPGEVTTSFFYGGSTPPEQNTVDALIDQLNEKVAAADEDRVAAEQAKTEAQTAASNAALSESNVAGLAEQAQETLTEANEAVAAANAAVAGTATNAALAQDWAIKTTGPVTGTEYSAKYWAQQVSGVAPGKADVDGTNATGTWPISITGNAATVSNGVVTTGSYANPSWITSLAGSKLTGTVVATNGVVTTGSYANPSWITSLAASKLTGTIVATNGVVTTGSYANPSWITSLAYSKLTGAPTAVSSFTNDAGYLTGITSTQVTTALGFTPYNASNPSGYIDTNGTARTIVANNGTTVGTRRAINFIPGTGVTLSVADDSANERVDVTINSAGAAAGVSSFNTRTGAVTLTSTDVTDALAYTPVNRAGDTLTGKITLPTVTTSAAPLNLGVGATNTAPTTPVTGDVWVNTTNGLQVRIGANTRTAALLQVGQTFSGNNSFTGNNTFTGLVDVSGAGGSFIARDNSFTIISGSKQAQFDVNGISNSTTRTYTLPDANGTVSLTNFAQTFSAAQTFSNAVTMSTATGALAFGTSQTTGTWTAGAAAGTGTMTLGQSTVSQTTNIQAGATASGSTKTLNIGTGGLAGSTTNIAIGSAAGTTAVTANGTWTYANTISGSISGNAGTVTNGVYTNGSYADPAWITSLSYSKITGTPTIALSALSDVTITSPAAGQYLTYNGTGWVNSAAGSASRVVSEFTATAGQTSFSPSGGYTSGFIDVFVNGVRLPASEYTATNGTTVVLATGAAAGDDVMIVAWGTFSVASVNGSNIVDATVTPAKLSSGAPTWDSNNSLIAAKAIKENVFTITDGASVDLNPANGTVQVWTLGASRSPTATNFVAGQSMTLMVDDGSGFTITWPSVTWVGGSAPTLATTGFTVIELWEVGTTLYGSLVGNV
jgi:hypothetical protein